ncbi:MAG: hypothetical protein QXN36_00335 [Candidatus Bathyarchaeia archaeon]
MKNPKTKLAIFLLTAIILLLIQLPQNPHQTKHASAQSTPVTISWYTQNVTTLEAYQRKTFFANGRYWAFYAHAEIKYKTSTDGITWTAEAAICPGGPDGGVFSTWFDGIHIHYVRSTGIPTESLRYRRGTPNPDGTITWSTPDEQIALEVADPLQLHEPFVTVDSEGYPWIGYRWGTNGDRWPNCTKSAFNNGTWQTASGFPYQLSTLSAPNWAVSIVPLTQQKVYAVYLSIGAIRGRLWNATAFENEELIAPASVSPARTRFAHSVVARENNVYFTFLNVSTTIKILFFNRTYETGWGSPETIETGIGETAFPVLSIDQTKGDFYCFWADNDIIYYKKCIEGAWDQNATAWLTEPNMREDSLTCFYQTGGSRIGIMWIRGQPYVFDIRYCSLKAGILRKLNLRVFMNDMLSPLSSATIIMNDGLDNTMTTNSEGWANFTEITAPSVTVKVKWQDNWVNGTFAVTMDSDKTVNVQCKVYRISFTNTFKDGDGNPLYAPPQTFSLNCPNGTTLQGLLVGAYYLQNGTFNIEDVMWQGTNVTPPNTSFNPEHGDPSVNLSIYSPTLQVLQPNDEPFTNYYIDMEFPNGTIIKNQHHSSSLIEFNQIQAGTYHFNITTFDGEKAQVNYTLLIASSQELYNISTTALKLSEYGIDLPNAKIYLRLTFYNGTPVHNGIINYASQNATTDNDGWATFNLKDFSNISYLSIAYGIRSASGITYKMQNQSIPIAKVSHIILESDLANITTLEYNATSYTLTIVATDNGTKTIRILGEKPLNVTIDDVSYAEGTKWHYDANNQIITITDAWSTKTIKITWAPPPEINPFLMLIYYIAAIVGAFSLAIILVAFYLKKKSKNARSSANKTNINL